MTEQARDQIPRWLADHGFDALQKAREAEAAKQGEARDRRQRFLDCYPKAARALFNMESSFPDKKKEAEQGKKIARVIGDPVDVAVATCRALGTMDANAASGTARTSRNGGVRTRPSS
jgi:hypothetical protein